MDFNYKLTNCYAIDLIRFMGYNFGQLSVLTAISSSLFKESPRNF